MVQLRAATMAREQVTPSKGSETTSAWTRTPGGSPPCTGPVPAWKPTPSSTPQAPSTATRPSTSATPPRPSATRSPWRSTCRPGSSRTCSSPARGPSSARRCNALASASRPPSDAPPRPSSPAPPRRGSPTPAPTPSGLGTSPGGPLNPEIPLGHRPAPANGVGRWDPAHPGAELPEMAREPVPPAQPRLQRLACGPHAQAWRVRRRPRRTGPCR
jgi:hypothetical protein